MITLVMFVTLMLLLLTESSPLSIPNGSSCASACGNLSIPFPFGTAPNCSLDRYFLVTCNREHKPFLGSVEILDISLAAGLMRVASSVAADCYDASGSRVNGGAVSELSIGSPQFTVSSSRNKFVAVGCDTHALVGGSEGRVHERSVGCVSWCDSMASVANRTDCSGIGCCQTSIPDGVRGFVVDIKSFSNHTRVRSFNPCGYAFVVEDGAYKFVSSDLEGLGNMESVPVVLDWYVGNVGCREARRNFSGFACRANHSECSDSSNGDGYLCKCLDGFEGNPYLFDGCQDINECDVLNPCSGTCLNLEGTYSCSCPKGFEGDGKKDGDGCHSKSHTTLFYIVSGFVMVPAVSWILRRGKQKKVDKLRKTIFISNGGKILEHIQRLSHRKTLAVFTAQDLTKAPNNYDDDQIIHTDPIDNEKTYKGELPDRTNREITIQKINTDVFGYFHDIEAFINKIVALSRVSHQNVAKPIGCCLETQRPLIVYDFITINTLYDYIHSYVSIPWYDRLMIALDTASALAYMHATSIIHGKLSSSSVLINQGSTAILCYFGFFRNTNILDYVDIDCMTEKGDVYSFGMMLAELLTGKDVYCSDRPDGEHILSHHFMKAIRQDDLVGILDGSLMSDGEIEMVKEAGKVAEQCLSDLPVNRPTMKEVVIALENAISGNSSSICASSSQGTTSRRVVRRNKSF